MQEAVNLKSFYPALALIRMPRDPESSSQEPDEEDDFGTGFFATRNGVLLTAAHNLTTNHEPDGPPLRWVWVCCFDRDSGDWSEYHRVEVNRDLISPILDAAILLVNEVSSASFLLASYWRVKDNVAVIGFQPDSKGNGFTVRYLPCHIHEHWSVLPLYLDNADGEQALRLAFDSRFELLKGISGGPVLNYSLPETPAIAIEKAIEEPDGRGRQGEVKATALQWLHSMFDKLPEDRRPPLDICPFRGLDSFREGDRRFFYGREDVLHRMLERLQDQRFLAVFGPSGIGKSSILQAGVIPVLKERGSGIVLFTPQKPPLEKLAFALHELGSRHTVLSVMERLKESNNSLDQIVQELLKETGYQRLFIVIDQFEDLFTQTNDKIERQQFLSVLRTAAEIPGGSVSVILSMRSDFIGKFAEYPEFNAFVNDSFFQIESMSRKDLARAISEPADRVGLTFEKGLIERILEDVQGAAGELPLLGHALLELYEKREGSQLTLQGYQDIGGVDGALVKRADTEFERLNVTQQQIIRKMFVLRLIQPGDGREHTRRRATREELLAIGPKKTADDLIERWIDARLLTTSHDKSRDQDVIDVAHEALIRKWGKIQSWMNEDREAARLMDNLRRAAEGWDRSRGDPSYLFQGLRLAQIEELRKAPHDNLPPMENSFFEASIRHRDRERRRLVRRSIVTVIVSAIIVAIFGFFAISLNKSNEEVQSQLSRSYWDNARQARAQGDLLSAMHLLVEAAMVNPGSGSDKNLLLDLDHFWPSFTLKNMIQHQGLSGAILSAEETRILTWGSDSTARLWDTRTGEQIGISMEHQGIVRGATFNADETRILTWSRDNTARLWNAHTGEQSGPSPEHEDVVWGARFSPDGEYILTWSDDRTARLWDTSTGEQVGVPMKHQDDVTGAVFSLDGKHILTWSDDNTARLWDANTTQQIGTPMRHQDDVTGAVFSANESRIVTWSSDNTARIWDTRTGEQIGISMEHQGIVRGATFNADETRILTWSRDNTARLWNAHTGEQSGIPMKHQDDVWGARFSPDGDILTWSSDNTARLWDTSTGEQVGVPMKHQDDVTGAVFSLDGKHILTWSDDNTARLWDANTTKQIGTPIKHQGVVWGARFSPDEKHILTWSSDNTTRLWKIEPERNKGYSMQHRGVLLGAMLSAARGHVLTWSSDSTARLWDTRTGEQIGISMEHQGIVRGATFNADETRILSWSGNSARIWDVRTGQQLGSSMMHEGIVRGAMFSPDETRILTWSDDNTACLWDARTGEQISAPIEQRGGILGAMFSPDETRILTWSRDNTVRLWNSRSSAQLGSPMMHEGIVRGAMFSPDETRILTWSDDNTARFWDANTTKQIGTPIKHQGVVWGARFSPDGKYILTWSSDNTARLWDSRNGMQVGPPMAHQNWVTGATFSADGTRILTWGKDNTARLWDSRNGMQIGPPMAHQNWVTGATFSADGTRILTWGRDNTARLWNVGLDIDFPKNKLGLQAKVLTGTELNLHTRRIETLAPRRWRELKREYLDLARQHYEKCKYTSFNFYHQFSHMGNDP